MSRHAVNRERARAVDVMLAGAPSGDSEAVRWWQLITEAEGFRARTGWQLAGTWGQIHRGDYAGARASLDALLAEEMDGELGERTVWIP
jgi:hypothetical protein